MENNTTLSPFEGIQIRKLWHNDEWFFSIIDVIGILTDSKDSNQYWKKMKSRDPQMFSGAQIVPLSIGKRNDVVLLFFSDFRKPLFLPVFVGRFAKIF